jgi:hypothetical protein
MSMGNECMKVIGWRERDMERVLRFMITVIDGTKGIGLRAAERGREPCTMKMVLDNVRVGGLQISGKERELAQPEMGKRRFASPGRFHCRSSTH